MARTIREAAEAFVVAGLIAFALIWVAQLAFGAEKSELDACIAEMQRCSDRAFVDAPTPKPTAAPTPKPTAATPKPTASPTPDGSGLTFDFPCSRSTSPGPGVGKYLEAPLGEGWGIDSIPMNPGQVRLYCADAKPPNGIVKVQWYDRSDRGCGRVLVEVQQTTGAKIYQTSGSPLPDGNLRYSTGFFGMWPDNAAPGIYKIRVTGGTSTCSPSGGTDLRLVWGYR